MTGAVWGGRETNTRIYHETMVESGARRRLISLVPVPNPYRGLRGLPADVWMIAATTLVNRAGMMALPFLVLYLTRYLHISASLAGLAISAYGVGGLVTAPVAGRLADRVGPYAVLRASLALSGLILLIIPLATDIRAIFLLTFLWAVVADAARPATMSALTGSARPEQRKAAIALNRLAVNLGMSIGPAVGGFLAVVSFPLLFVVDGLTSLAAAALLSALLWARHRRTPAAQEPHAEAATAAVRTAAWESAPVVWRDRAALLFFLTSFLMNIVFAQHQGAMPLYLVRDLHYRESFYGGLFVLNTLIIVAVEVPLNVAMSHWPSRPTIALATALVAIGFGALGIAQSALAIAGTVVIWTFGEMMFFPTATAYVSELAPAGRTGEYMGAFSATFSLALIVGPWAGATLLDRFGGPITWSAVLVCGLVAAALVGLARGHAPSQGRG
jgi:predicted MFS family arabinose efflux permease